MAYQGCTDLFAGRYRVVSPDEDTDQRALPHCCSCLLNRHVKHYIIIDRRAQMFALPSSLVERWKLKCFYSPGFKTVFAEMQRKSKDRSSFSADLLSFEDQAYSAMI